MSQFAIGFITDRRYCFLCWNRSSFPSCCQFDWSLSRSSKSLAGTMFDHQISFNQNFDVFFKRIRNNWPLAFKCVYQTRSNYYRICLAYSNYHWPASLCNTGISIQILKWSNNYWHRETIFYHLWKSDLKNYFCNFTKENNFQLSLLSYICDTIVADMVCQFLDRKTFENLHGKIAIKCKIHQ